MVQLDIVYSHIFPTYWYAILKCGSALKVNKALAEPAEEHTHLSHFINLPTTGHN